MPWGKKGHDDELDCYTSAWVNGHRFIGKTDNVELSFELLYDEPCAALKDPVRSAVHRLREAGMKLGESMAEEIRPNAVLSIELYLDPFYVSPENQRGLSVKASAKLVRLEPLFPPKDGEVVVNLFASWMGAL